MSIKRTALRSKPDFTLPCPVCGEACQPIEVAKSEETKITTPTDDTFVFSKDSLELHCQNCGLDLWLMLDDAGKPIPYN